MEVRDPLPSSGDPLHAAASTNHHSCCCVFKLVIGSIVCGIASGARQLRAVQRGNEIQWALSLWCALQLFLGMEIVLLLSSVTVGWLYTTHSESFERRAASDRELAVDVELVSQLISPLWQPLALAVRTLTVSSSSASAPAPTTLDGTHGRISSTVVVVVIVLLCFGRYVFYMLLWMGVVWPIISIYKGRRGSLGGGHPQQQDTSPSRRSSTEASGTSSSSSSHLTPAATVVDHLAPQRNISIANPIIEFRIFLPTAQGGEVRLEGPQGGDEKKKKNKVSIECKDISGTSSTSSRSFHQMYSCLLHMNDFNSSSSVDGPTPLSSVFGWYTITHSPPESQDVVEELGRFHLSQVVFDALEEKSGGSSQMGGGGVCTPPAGHLALPIVSMSMQSAQGTVIVSLSSEEWRSVGTPDRERTDEAIVGVALREAVIAKATSSPPVLHLAIAGLTIAGTMLSLVAHRPHYLVLCGPLPGMKWKTSAMKLQKCVAGWKGASHSETLLEEQQSQKDAGNSSSPDVGGAACASGRLSGIVGAGLYDYERRALVACGATLWCCRDTSVIIQLNSGISEVMSIVIAVDY